jgi:hypothetical protein
MLGRLRAAFFLHGETMNLRFQFTIRRAMVSVACFAAAFAFTIVAANCPVTAKLVPLYLTALSVGAGVGVLFGRPIIGAIAVGYGFSLLLMADSMIRR